MNKWLTCILLSIGIFYSCQAQSDLLNNVAPSDSTAQVEKKKNGMLSMFSGNPGKAALLSLILPGAGQAYNKKYWKVPIAIAMDAGMIAIVLHNHDRFTGYRTAVGQFQTNEITEFRRATSAREAFEFSRRFRKRRDNFIIGLVIVHIVQVSDAFISRHLIEFDVSDDLSFGFSTSEYGVGVAINF